MRSISIVSLLFLHLQRCFLCRLFTVLLICLSGGLACDNQSPPANEPFVRDMSLPSVDDLGTVQEDAMIMLQSDMNASSLVYDMDLSSDMDSSVTLPNPMPMPVDPPAPDQDQDGIADEWDPEPDNPLWPGRTYPDTVYAHTATTLYALDVKREELLPVCDFNFNAEEGVDSMEVITDIAISRAGVLWAISFNRLFICHPQTGECRVQGQLSDQSSLNGLTFLPASLVDRQQDILVGIDQYGEWLILTTGNPDEEILEESMGRYGIGNRSSGDVFSIENVGTFASIKRSGEDSDLIAQVDPTRILLFDDLLFLDGYSAIFGLAGWRGVLFAFDESGAILRIRLDTLDVEEIHNQELPWWGAGVSPVLPANVVP